MCTLKANAKRADPEGLEREKPALTEDRDPMVNSTASVLGLVSVAGRACRNAVGDAFRTIWSCTMKASHGSGIVLCREADAPTS